MNLQQIADDLKKKISDEKLSLDNSIIKQDSFAFVLSYFDNNVIPLTGLSDPGKQIAVEGKVLTITAVQTQFTIKLNVTITLTQQDDDTLESDYATQFSNATFNNLVVWKIIPTSYFDPSVLPTLPFDKISMTISSADSVQTWLAINSSNVLTLIPAIGLKLTNIGFSIQRSPNLITKDYETTFTLSGTFILGKTNLSVAVTVPVSISTPKGQWSLSLSSTSTLADGIADLSQLVFGNNLFAALPPGFQGAFSFSISQLLLVFSLSDKSVKYIKIVITRPVPWVVVSNFTVLDAGATFSISKESSSYSLDTSLYGKFLIGKEDSPTKAYLDVLLNIPPGKNDWLAQISGSIENNGIKELFSSLPASNGQSLPAFPIGLSLEKITLEFLKISFNPGSKTLTYISFSVTSILDLNIFDILHVQNPHVALDIRNPTLATQRTVTGNVGGILIIANVPFAILADKPSADTGWTFSAAMLPDSKIPLMDMVRNFLKTLNIQKLPDWVEKASLDISAVKLSVYMPTKDAPDQNKKYHAEGTVKWAVKVDSFQLPELTATVVMDYSNSKASGNISVAAKLLGLPFKVGYKFGTADTEVYLEWLGIQADYKHNKETLVDVVTITFADMSVGAIITHLIASFEPGFTLPPPWNALNSINLSGLSLKYTQDKNDETKNKIEILYTKKIDLTFITIDSVTLTKDKTGVFMGFKGTFLGMAISSDSPDPDVKKLAGKGSDVREIGDIPVPAMGTQYFDLDYLGLGQKVALYPYKDLKTVDQAITALKTVFLPPVKPAPGKPPILPIKITPKDPVASSLIFSEESNWLIATKFTIIEAITLGVIFNDPNLYGLLVKLDGEKVKGLSGLNFQILYKKVTDSVGVYQIELKLPDSIRELQFGAVSVTLPIIGIDIYTNGSFKLDFGFPYNMDFSRSLTIQAFPFTGSGGFYIAYLKDVPSDNVPKTTVGTFNPIIEFGLGLQLGIGKSINKGILKAGFSITVIGIFEGVIAFYTPNNVSYPGKGETYYKISATVGIVGRLYGEINFAIISASLDITVYAYVQMIVEAYRKIPIYLEAGVSVSLKVTINLGIFKISINLHFSTTISASFTIGADSTAPWDYLPPHSQLHKASLLEKNTSCGNISVNWQPLILTAAEQENEKLSLYFFPQLTVAANGSAQPAQFSNVLYIDSPVDGSTTDASLNKFVKAVLYWCINAAINSDKTGTTLDDLKKETVTYDILKQLHAYLSDTAANPSPIPYDHIEPFMKAYFKVNVMDPDFAIAENKGKDVSINASIFPIFPMLNISYQLNGASTKLSSYNVDDKYMEAVEKELRKLQVNYRNQLEQETDHAEETAHGVSASGMLSATAAEQSMPAFIFQDYVLMAAKSAIQDAINEFEKYTWPITANDSLDTVAAHFNKLTYVCSGASANGMVITNDLTAAALATANSAVLFNEKLPLRIPGLSYQVRYGDSLKLIADLYKISVAQLNNDNNTDIQGLIAVNTVVSISGFNDYHVATGQTIKQIAGSMEATSGAAKPTTEQVMLALADKKVLLSLAKLALPELTCITTATDSFETLSTYYGISINDLASNAVNSATKNLFKAASVNIPDLNVLEVGALVDSFDTTDNIARISGMAARYFLHGMRLPVPGNLNTVSALYSLSGQQFAIPAVKTGDKFSIQLNKTGDTGAECWMKLNNACVPAIDVKINDNTISRINDLVTIQLNPDTAPLPPQPLPLGKEANETFTLKPGFIWQYPGKLSLPIGTPPAQLVTRPSIWIFSDALMSRLVPVQPPVTTDLGLEVIKLVKETSEGGFTKQPVNYAFSTIVEVSIQELASKSPGATVLDNVYEVIGANDTSIVLLERLIQHMNFKGSDSFIQQVQLLYPPDNTGNTPNGLQSAANGNITLALVQANLSTETNPGGDLQHSFAKLLEDEKPNTINSFKQFISYLWQCSIVRTGGYYLYYKTGDGNGLPSSLFSESKTGKISILVTYRDSISYNFVNSVTIADTIDKGNTTVYIKADKLTSLAAVTPPGNAGFRLERKKPDDYVPITPYPIPANAASKIQDSNYLNYQYNLIGYQLIENDTFRAVYSLLPVGPTHEPGNDEFKKLKALPSRALADENWKYTSILPLAKNVKDAKRIQPAKNTYPAAADDPYAGIGSSVKVRLNWQDMFGNTINTQLSDGSHDITLSSLYTDNLYSIAQWPSVSAYYSFPSKAGQPQLLVELVFDRSRYSISKTITKEDAVNNAKIDLVTYQKIYYQLVQKDIAISLQSNINKDAVQNKFAIAAAILYGFAGDLCAFLNAVIADPLKAVPPANIAVPNDIDLKNSERIFELSVQFSITRTANIDPAFAAIASVKQADALIKPVTKAPVQAQALIEEEKILSLTAFAAQFEQTFKDRPAAGNFLKIATGLDRTNNDAYDKKVWVVHFDVNGKDGIYYKIDNSQQYFYAPMPLANSLETFDKVSISAYKSGESYPYGAPQLKTFSDIDLDSWGKTCLEAIDLFLTAEYATPAFLIDKGDILQKILDAKELIAEGIAGNVNNIIKIENPDHSSLANAKEKLKQQLLIQLANAYKINTIVQNAVKVSHGFAGSNVPPGKSPFVPQLYGDMTGTLASMARAKHALFGSGEKTSDEYTLSTAKIPLGDGDSWLTYLFQAKEADKHSSFNFSDMAFKISYIEHQVDTVKDMGEYKASSWLTLIIPLEAAMSEVGPVEIPVALRSYPTPPSLTNQQIDYAPSGGKEKTTTIEQALQWGYDFSYLPPMAGQDQVHAQLQFNYNSETDNLRSMFYDSDGNYDASLLPATLAQFITVYLAIQQDFVNVLIKEPGDPVAAKAVAAFALLIKNIGTAWKKWNQVQADFKLKQQLMAASLPVITYDYDIIEEPQPGVTKEPNLYIKVNAINGAPALAISLPGYTTKENMFYKVVDGVDVYLKYDERKTVASRNLGIDQLIVLEKQNAWSGVLLTRNQDLLENKDGTFKKTNDSFIYKTPLVKFYNELVPLLVCNETINIAEIEKPGKPAVLNLAKHLQNLFKTLLQNSNNLNQTIKVEAVYQYNLQGAGSFNQISIPILLATPMLFVLNKDWEIGTEGSYCQNSTSITCNLTQLILQWFKNNDPNLNNGDLQFIIEIYNMTNNKLPILKLSNVILGVEYIKELNS